MAELHSRPIFESEKTPSDCWDWITREDVTRHALAAFEMARRQCFPPAGERFIADGVAWTGRESFAEDLADCFAVRIKAAAHDYGIGDFAPEAKRLLLWTKPSHASTSEPSEVPA